MKTTICAMVSFWLALNGFTMQGNCHLGSFEKKGMLTEVKSFNDLLKTSADKRAQNFSIINEKFGQKISHNDHRMINADGFHLSNFIFEDVEYVSGQAKKATWTNFKIKGTLRDWEFNDTTFENGFFSIIFENVKFENVTFRNVSWGGSYLVGASFKNCIGAPR